MYKANQPDAKNDEQAALRHRGDKKTKQRKNGLSDQMPSSIEQNMNSSKDVRSIGPA